MPPVCSVCNGEVFGRNDWPNHLTLQEHQILARKECLEEWDPQLRKSVLLVYSSKNMTTGSAGKIITYSTKMVEQEGSLNISGGRIDQGLQL